MRHAGPRSEAYGFGCRPRAVVSNLPEGGEEVKIGDQTYVKFGETYYQPSQSNGKEVYEVVQVKEATG